MTPYLCQFHTTFHTLCECALGYKLHCRLYIFLHVILLGIQAHALHMLVLLAHLDDQAKVVALEEDVPKALRMISRTLNPSTRTHLAHLGPSGHMYFFFFLAPFIAWLALRANISLASTKYEQSTRHDR